MAKTLVTGASGFVGSHLCEALATRGEAITCLVRRTSQVEHLKPLGVRLAYGDLDQPEALAAAVAGQDVVYHVAGLIAPRRKVDLYEVNGRGVGRVAEACAAAQPTPPVLIVVSSLAAAGPSPEGGQKQETDPPAPVSHYGRSKLAGEEAARQWADRVPTTIVRPPIVFGPRDRACYQWYRGIARAGIHFVPGWRRQVCSMIHAADLVRLLILAAQRGERTAPPDRQDAPAGQGCYFADCGQYPSYAEMGRMIARALGRRRIFVWHMIRPTVWTIAAAADVIARLRGRPFYLSVDKIREALAGDWVCSARKAADQLGFAPAASLQQRMQQTADWYRQQGWL